MPHSLIVRERVKDRARYVQQHSAATNRQLARAFGVDESTAAHWKNGRIESSPFFRVLTAVTSKRATDPYPLCVEVEAVLMETHLATKPTDWLIRRWRELDAKEHSVEGAQNHARCERDEDRSQYRRSALEHARVLVELAALDEVLEQRGVDPYGRGDK